MKWVVSFCLLTAATAQAEIYRWRDARGTVHYTNSEYEIPARYKNRAVVLNLGLPVSQASSPPPVAGVPPTPPADNNAVGSAPVVRPVAPSSPVAAPSSPPAASPRATKRQRYRGRSTSEDE